MPQFSDINAAFAYADTLGLRVYRDAPNHYVARYDESQHIITEGSGVNVYYIDAATGSDANDGSEGSPKATLNGAVTAGNAATLDAAIYRMVSGTHTAAWTTVPDHPVMVEGWGGDAILDLTRGSNSGWTQNATYPEVYNQTYSSLGLAVDSGRSAFQVGVTTPDGFPKPMNPISGAENVAATEGNYTGGSVSVNVHPYGGGSPTDAIRIGPPANTLAIHFVPADDLTIRNLTIYGACELSEGVSNTIAIIDVLQVGGTADGWRFGSDVLATSSRVVAIRSASVGNRFDGWNYNSNVQAIEIECFGCDNGFDGNPQHNGTTLHNDAATVSVNGVYNRNLRNVHDINDSRRMLIGCVVKSSRGDDADGDNVNVMVGSTLSGGGAKTWLIGGDISGGSRHDVFTTTGTELFYAYDHFSSLRSSVSGTLTEIANPFEITQAVRGSFGESTYKRRIIR